MTTVASVTGARRDHLRAKLCDSLIEPVDHLEAVLGGHVELTDGGARFLEWVLGFDHTAVEGLAALVGDVAGGGDDLRAALRMIGAMAAEATR